MQGPTASTPPTSPAINPDSLADVYVIDVDGPKLKTPVKEAMYRVLCANSSTVLVSVSHISSSEIGKKTGEIFEESPDDSGTMWMTDLKSAASEDVTVEKGKEERGSDQEVKPSAASILGAVTNSAVQVATVAVVDTDTDTDTSPNTEPDTKTKTKTKTTIPPFPPKKIWSPPRVPQSILWANLSRHRQMLMDFSNPSNPANEDTYPDRDCPERCAQRNSISVVLAKASCDEYAEKKWTNATKSGMEDIARVCFARYLIKHKHVRFSLDEEEEILDSAMKMIGESGKVVFEDPAASLSSDPASKEDQTVSSVTKEPKEPISSKSKKGLTRRPFRKVTGTRSKIPPTWSKLVLNEEGDMIGHDIYVCGGDSDGKVLVFCSPDTTEEEDRRYLVGIYDLGGGDSSSSNKGKGKGKGKGKKSKGKGKGRGRGRIGRSKGKSEGRGGKNKDRVERRRGGYVKASELGAGPLAVEWACDKRRSVNYAVVGIRGGGARLITIPASVRSLPEKGSKGEWLSCVPIVGMETEASITSLKRVPGHPDTLLSSHMDGTLHQLCVATGRVKRLFGSMEQAMQTVLDGRYTMSAVGFPPDILRPLESSSSGSSESSPLLPSVMSKEPLLAGIALHSTGSFQSFWDGDLHKTVDPKEQPEPVTKGGDGEGEEAVKWPYGRWHSNQDCITKLEGTNSILSLAAGVLPNKSGGGGGGGGGKKPMLMMTDPYGHMYFCHYTWTPRPDKTGWHISWDMVCAAIPPYKGLRTDPRTKTPMYVWSSVDGLGLAVGCHGNGCLRMVRVCEKASE